METQAFVYKWTHVPTMKWYIGSRTAKGCHPNDGYICSSRIVKPMIIETKQDWTREIIATGTPKKMFELETEILQMFNAKNDIRSFNKQNNDGVGENQYPYFKEGHTPWNKGLPAEDQPGFGYKHTIENKELFSKQKLGCNNPAFGKTPWNKGIKTGNKWYNNGKTSKLFVPGTEPVGFILGRVMNTKWYNNGKEAKQFIPGKEPNNFILGRKLSVNTDKI